MDRHGKLSRDVAKSRPHLSAAFPSAITVPGSRKVVAADLLTGSMRIEQDGNDGSRSEQRESRERQCACKR